MARHICIALILLSCLTPATAGLAESDAGAAVYPVGVETAPRQPPQRWYLSSRFRRNPPSPPRQPLSLPWGRASQGSGFGSTASTCCGGPKACRRRPCSPPAPPTRPKRMRASWAGRAPRCSSATMRCLTTIAPGGGSVWAFGSTTSKIMPWRASISFSATGPCDSISSQTAIRSWPGRSSTFSPGSRCRDRCLSRSPCRESHDQCLHRAAVGGG